MKSSPLAESLRECRFDANFGLATVGKCELKGGALS